MPRRREEFRSCCSRTGRRCCSCSRRSATAAAAARGEARAPLPRGVAAHRAGLDAVAACRWSSLPSRRCRTPSSSRRRPTCSSRPSTSRRTPRSTGSWPAPSCPRCSCCCRSTSGARRPRRRRRRGARARLAGSSPRWRAVPPPHPSRPSSGRPRRHRRPARRVASRDGHRRDDLQLVRGVRACMACMAGVTVTSPSSLR